MNPTDLAIAAVAGVVGFGIIWGIFGLIKQRRAAAVDMFKVEPRSLVEGRDKLSLVELGRTWHVILGVSAEATSEEIESGYHARLGECYFFFQAEDGIRDLTVTGVQTCALPI